LRPMGPLTHCEGRISEPSAHHFHPADKPAAPLTGLIRRLRWPAYRGAPEGLKRVKYPE
jgi:hypothetical protein